jgi:putative membrane-bound dehydrogenase-like protein
MNPRRCLLACAVLLTAWPATRAADAPFGLRVPPGFEVTEFADSRLANDIFCMTLDPRGRVVVSGHGYIRILVDDDSDGRADRAIDFADGPKDGAQGMLWEGDSLYVVGDGGLRRYHDADGDGRADGPSELIRAIKTGGEHDAHALRRGPDGWLYLLCGNMAGVDRSLAQLPTSPIREPVAGCVLRFTPDLKRSEIVADGYRNPYGMDFDLDGELFTFDSDNERCVSLPWYEPTRFYHVIPGGHYGWQAPQHGQFWRMPPYFPDVVPPVATLGRGSPTGVVCYRHVQFPEAYRGGMFLLDWTFGRVYFLSLTRRGASYTCTKQVFLESVGDNGFAPTAAVVHPGTGDLYIAIGGRGTRGAVYRIRYPKGVRPMTAAEQEALRIKPRSLDWHDGLGRALVKQATGKDDLERLHALLAMRWHRQRLDSDDVLNAVLTNCNHQDRVIREAAAALLAALPGDRQRRLSLAGVSDLGLTTVGFGTVDRHPHEVLDVVLRLVPGPKTDAGVRLAAVRLLQRALGGLMSPRAKGLVWEGYSPRVASLDRDLVTRAAPVLREAFPAGHADLDRELSRTLAVIEDGDPGVLARVADKFTADSDPVEDTHYLIAFARLRAPRSPALTRRIASALLALDRKLTQRHLNRDTNWPLRVGELYAELARQDPALHAAMLADPEFGRPDHALFAHSPGFDRRRAAEIFLARAEKDDEYPWTASLVGLLDTLSAERTGPLLRRLWDRGGLEDAVLPLLARQPLPENRAKFLRGLESPQLATVRLCLEALEKLPDTQDGGQVLALVRALRRLPAGKEEDRLRGHLGRFLARLTGQKQLAADREAWTAWLTRTHPELGARLGGSDGVDVAALARRLAAVDWSAGDAGRGRAVFQKASCAACHSGAQALGPDLQGVAGRFSRADLFTAILQPSKDVSPRYRTTQIATDAGKVYQGLIIYEAVDGLILQTGPATTVRVAAAQIAERRLSDTSLMPTGLLDRLTDREIADLYAYLKGLGGPGAGREDGGGR